MHIIENIMRLSDRCTEEKERQSVAADLSAREIDILLSFREGETITGQEVSARNGLSASRSSRIVDHLVQKGYVVRHFHEDDRRFLELSLTPKGGRQRRALAEFNMKCEQKLHGKLTNEERRVIVNALEILLRVFEGEMNGVQNGSARHHK